MTQSWVSLKHSEEHREGAAQMNVRGDPCRKEVHSGYLSPSGGGGGICAVDGDGDCPPRDVSLSTVRRAFVQGQSQHKVSEPEWGKKGYVGLPWWHSR